tara:strand:- start:862 stop:1581 length:720 start_codon:yes stop_codon:yes gene_type:complete
VSVFAFIFARGGSKGLPKKNIKLINGKPLIAWSIEQAKVARNVDRVFVSTDCPEISSIAQNFGAEVPFLRPSKLAADDSPELLSWKHALIYLKENEGISPDVMVSVPPTSPLRLSFDIDKCIEKFLEGNSDVTITVSKSSRNPYFNMVEFDKNNLVRQLMPLGKTTFRRQDAPKVFDITTVAYASSPKFVLSNDSLFSENSRINAIEVPSERAIDIDNLLDFEIAEFLMKKWSNFEENI